MKKTTRLGLYFLIITGISFFVTQIFVHNPYNGFAIAMIKVLPFVTCALFVTAAIFFFISLKNKDDQK